MAQPKIQQLTTPAGIPFWLVESHQIPFLSVEVDFRAGSAYDPAGQEGLANFTVSLLDEGSGTMDATAFKEAMDDIGARYSYTSDITDLNVTLDTLTENRQRAFELLGQSLMAPRFDDEAVMRVRTAILAGIKRGEENPSRVATKAFDKAVFGPSAYGHPTSGATETVSTFNAADARRFWAQNINRANMVVSIVGDVTPADAQHLVDVALARLPAGTSKNPDPTMPATTQTSVTHIQKDVPQATLLMGHLGIPRNHPDYWNTLVMNELLGGGILTSRLYHSVREQNGLAYSVSSYNVPLPGSGEWLVNVETGNATAQKALDLIRAEIERIRTTEVPQDEFNDVIDYLVGSFPLRIDTNRKILGYLSVMQMEGLGADYLTEWVARVKAVKRQDMQRVAAQLIHPEAMALVVVGNGPALKVQ